MFQRTKICSGLLLAFGSSLLTIAPGAFAQDSTVQRVEITGSSIKRVDAETSEPVTVLKADDLKKQGVTTVEQILQNVSAVQVQQGTAQAIGLGTGGASFADLRGLGANKTLVLLNGRRIANSAFDSSAPDLNSIPFAAIERVEVLRDGASALYGTDAISGVINFITRKDYRGGTITVGLDAPQHPGGASHSANAGFGFGDYEKDGFNIFGFANFDKQAAISAAQRPYYQHQYLSHETYAPSGTTFPATYLGYDISGGASAAAPVSVNATPYGGPACLASANLYPNQSTQPNRCGEITSNFIQFVPASAKVSALLNASFKINENHKFTLDSFVSQSKVNGQTAPVPDGALYLSKSSPYYPGNGITPLPAGVTLSPDQEGSPGLADNDALFIKMREVQNGNREDDNTATQGRFSASLEGNLADWDYNLAATLNTNHVQDYLAKGYSNINKIATVQGAGSAIEGGYLLSNTINPFASTPAGDALLASAVERGVVLYGSGTVKVVDGHASRDLGDWTHAGRPAAIAIGGEYREENFLNKANSEFASQVIASTGIDPATYNAGERKVWAGYAELNVPIVKSLDVTAALRYDHYSDFGSTTNPKFSFRFQPIKAVLLRGSFSTGFRAPSLYELNAAQTFTNSQSGVSDPLNCPDGKTPLNGTTASDVCSTPNKLQFVDKLGGNTALKAEKSKNATFGLVLEPINNLTTEFDVYDIRITKEVGVLPDSLLYSQDGLAQFPGNFHYNSAGLLSGSPQQCPGTSCGWVDELNQNIGAVHTNGVDVAIGYKANAGAAGRFNFELQSTWVHSYKYQLVPGGPFTQNVGIFSDGSGQPVFRWQHNATIAWNLSPFSLGLSVHHKTGYRDENDDPDTTDYRRVSAYTTLDLYGSYSMPKGFSFTAGVKNLADRLPPYTNYAAFFQQGYDPRYYDPTGRTYYGRVTYSF
jgi:iron complex outermembrane recepter protein